MSGADCVMGVDVHRSVSELNELALADPIGAREQFISLYSRNASGGPIRQYDFSYQLGLYLDPNHLEADIEGATRISDRIYWIGSLGNENDSPYNPRPNRSRSGRLWCGWSRWPPRTTTPSSPPSPPPSSATSPATSAYPPDLSGPASPRS